MTIQTGIKRPPKRCYICKQDKPTRLVLMMGASGFRRYNLCDGCAKEHMKAAKIAYKSPLIQ